MADLYADENFPLPVVVNLRKLGHDVLTMLEDGRANLRIPDDEVLQISTSYQRALLTTNRKDFIQLHERNSEHAGIIVCTFDPDFVGQARRIDEVVAGYNNLKRELIRIYRAMT